MLVLYMLVCCLRLYCCGGGGVGTCSILRRPRLSAAHATALRLLPARTTLSSAAHAAGTVGIGRCGHINGVVCRADCQHIGCAAYKLRYADVN